jgi:dolichol-phosphate mannosyltransferase
LRHPRPSLCIVFYCYNEAPVIPGLARLYAPVERSLLGRYRLRTVLVDDGSTDGTLAAMRRSFRTLKSCRIVSYAPNRGVGGALREGFRHARGSDLVMTVPGELAFPLTEIPGMLRETGPDTDLVIASYNHPLSRTVGVPFFRLFLSRSLVFLYKTVLFLRTGKTCGLHTFSSGFRLYRGSKLERIRFKADDFLANSEIMLRFLLRGYRVREHLTILTWRKKGTGSRSKMRIFRTVMSHLRFMCSILFNKIDK